MTGTPRRERPAFDDTGPDTHADAEARLDRGIAVAGAVVLVTLLVGAVWLLR